MIFWELEVRKRPTVPEEKQYGDIKTYINSQALTKDLFPSIIPSFWSEENETKCSNISVKRAELLSLVQSVCVTFLSCPNSLFEWDGRYIENDPNFHIPACKTCYESCKHKPLRNKQCSGVALPVLHLQCCKKRENFCVFFFFFLTQQLRQLY